MHPGLERDTLHHAWDGGNLVHLGQDCWPADMSELTNKVSRIFTKCCSTLLTELTVLTVK